MSCLVKKPQKAYLFNELLNQKVICTNVSQSEEPIGKKVRLEWIHIVRLLERTEELKRVMLEESFIIWSLKKLVYSQS